MVLFVRQLFVSPHSEFEKHMYSSDSKPDTVSFMQLESRSAVPQASQSPSKASARTSKSTDSTDAEVKNHCRLRDHPHFFHFFVFFDSRPGSCQRICGIIIANKILNSAKAALIFFFALAGRTAAILDVAILCAVKGAQSKTRELP